MAAYVKFQPFVENLAEKVFNLGADTLKLLLTLVAPAATDGTKSQLTEIAAGNGYTAGGNTVTITASSQASGTYKLVGSDSTWTASGGSMANFRYAVFYDDTATNDELIGNWDYGATLTLTTGNSFTVDFDATNGILQIA
jgi:hypothetical protein